jgi:uncharacterized lipoprotein YajG
MKKIIPLLAVMLLAGCGNNSMNSNTSSTNDTVVNHPAMDATNMPAMTNNAADTNSLTMTNR